MRGARRVRQNKPSGSQRLTERDAQANHIPVFNSTVRWRHQFRFMASSALTGFAITRGFLLNLLSVGDQNVASAGSNLLSRLSSGVKLNRIEMRCPTGSTDVTVTTLALEWQSALGPTTEVSDTGTALHPPFISSSPPRQSVAGFWSLSGSSEGEGLFLLTVPTGTVIDVWTDHILQDGESPVTQVPTNNPVVGAVYCLALDGITSNVLKPVSYLTIN